MRDREDQTPAAPRREDSQQKARSLFGRRRTRASGTEAATAAQPRAASEEIRLSRGWGGAGIPLNITMVRGRARRIVDCRVLWGLPHGGDGYSLLPFVKTDERDVSTISFSVPAQALPGVYAIQLQDGNEFRRRFQFVVTSHEPPASSPFRILRTDPASGTLRMYLTFDRHRETPEKAIEEVAKLMKGYDTFFDPMPTDSKFQEILDESLTQYEKRQKLATWLVKNQLSAEEEA